ncbi:hypothetical protein TWF173_001008 [Orbilia oligospora]|nr:hypothetical protein TWF173_001008 [Orbilia oligospora]
MSQKYATSFHQQQVCTQPSSRTYTFDDADEDGVINIAIDAEQRLKDFMESCNSCDTLGDQMSKIVHGQCIELFRVRCDEGENGERRIQGLELDLRQLKRPEVGQMIGDSQSARMKLLEARMRGTDSSTATVEEDDVWLDNDEEEGLGSVRLLEGIQSIAKKYQDQEGEKRRRLGVDQEVIIRPTAKAGEETNFKESKNAEKNEDKSRASLLSTTKAVPLTQPRNRNSKQGSSVQMKSKKKNKKKNKEQKEDNNGIEITKIITPMESIIIYDAPTEGDLSLRNPQTAWAQRKGDELTITQGDEQIPTSPHSFPAGNGESDISGLMYRNRLDNEREKYRNLYSVQPPRGKPRTNVFILYSTEDEKASPHHRMDIFSQPANENNFPSPMMGSVKSIDPDDVFEENEMPISSLQRVSSDREHGDREQPGPLIIPPSSTLTHEDMDNDVATAMEALQLKDGGAGNIDLEATLDVLRRDQERVSAEINRLLEAQEKTRDQDREVDILLRESNMPPVKYTIMDPGQQFSLSQALDDLIDLGAQNAPNFEPQSPGEQGDGQISSIPLYIPSDGCKLPTQQQKQEWLDSIASSSTSTTSTEGSEFDLGDSISQADTYPRDGHSMISDTSQEPQTFTTAEGSMAPLLTPHLRHPQSFEAEVCPSVSLDDIPTPLAHPGPNVSPKTIRPLFERLGYEFENLDTSITRKGGKKQKIKSGMLKTEWTSDMQDVFESSYPQEKRHADGVERANLEVCGSDLSVSALGVSDKIQPLPDAKSSVEAHTEPEPEGFKIPTASFTLESDLVIDTEAPKRKVPETPLRLKLPMKTPLKGILKKTSQFTKLTDEGSLAIGPVGADRAPDKESKALRRSEIGRQTIYAKLPFPDVPFNGIANSGKPSKPTATPREEGKPGPPKLTEEQQYEIAVAKLSELPGFLEKGVNEEEIVENEAIEEGLAKEDIIKKDPINETVVEEYSEDEDMTLLASDGSDEEPEEETEGQNEIKRAIKGKAVDRETWIGLDCRFFELNSSTPFERRRPSSHYPRRPMRLQDDIIFARAIHESLVEAERDFEIWKRNELAAQSVDSEQALTEDVSFERESPAAPPEGINNAETAISIEKPHTPNKTYLERASAAHQPANSIDKNEQLDTRYLATSALDDEDDDPFSPAEERARKEAEKAKHSHSNISQSRSISNTTNTSISSVDSVITVVPLTPEQILQSPAEIYRAKQMALMQLETESKLELVRKAVADGLKKYETPRRIKHDKIMRDAEKKKEAAKRARQQSVPRQLPTPPKQKLEPIISTSPATPRRIRPGMSKAEIDQTMDDNEDWSDLINSSPSPAPRRQPQPQLDDTVKISKPQLRTLTPLKSCLRRPKPITTNTEESKAATDDKSPPNPEKQNLPETPRCPKVSLTLESSPNPKTPPKTNIDSPKPSSAKRIRKPGPPLPPRPLHHGISKGDLPLSVVRKYKILINTLCPPAWQMLEMFFAKLSRPDADYQNRDELVALVFWSCERSTGRRMADMTADRILLVVVDYVTHVLQEKDEE